MSKIGRAYISDSLTSEVVHRPTLRWPFKAILGGTQYYQNYVAAEQRLDDVIKQAAMTVGGHELLELASRAGQSASFETDYEVNYAFDDWKTSTTLLSPKNSDAVLANLLVHELCHARQNLAIAKTYGHPKQLFLNAQGYGDTAYPMLIGEADAFTQQVINAYELSQIGVPGPWAWQRFSPMSRVLADELCRQLEQGHALQSAETKEAIFIAWLTKSPSRLFYEGQYLDDLLSKPALRQKLSKPSVTYNQNTLDLPTVQPDGYSYISADLSAPPYIRFWANLSSLTDIKDAFVQISKAAMYTKGYLAASQILELLEDKIGANKWADLPSEHASLDEEEMASFGQKIRKAMIIVDTDKLDKERGKLNDLTRRAKALVKKEPAFKCLLEIDPFAPGPQNGNRAQRRRQERFNV